MPQIRKFEQDAIVDKTLSSIVSNKEEVIAKLEATSEYKNIRIRFDNIEDFEKRSKVLEKEISDEKDKLKEEVKVFNKDVLKSSPVYKLEYHSACWRDDESLVFNTEIGTYSTAGTTIANEIAIALLPKDAINDITGIIESIANSFKIELDSV